MVGELVCPAGLIHSPGMRGTRKPTPSSKDAISNLELCRMNMTDDIEADEEGYLNRFINSINEILGINFLTILTASFLFLTLTAFLLILYMERGRKRFYITLFTVSLILTLSVAAGLVLRVLLFSLKC